MTRKAEKNDVARKAEKESRRLRVAAHIHSDWSDDGSWSLERIAAAFRRRRYDALLMSEHSRGFNAGKWDRYIEACSAASSPELLVVPGIEYGDTDDVVHVPVWGDVPFFGEAPPVLDLLKRAAGEEGVSVLAHPWRRQAWRRVEPSWAEYLTAVEIWNRKYDGWAPNRAALALAQRERLRPFAALDFHTRRQFFPLAMALDVEGEPSRQSVHAALRDGRFEPLLFSVSCLRLAQGKAGRLLAAVEAARRDAARRVRSVRRGRR